MMNSLLEVQEIRIAIESFLNGAGEVFKAFREQDSSCVSYGVRVGETSWFIKYSDHPRGKASLERAMRIYSSVQHSALPVLRNSFTTPGDGLALVLDWLPGEVLYDYTRFRGPARLEDPASPLVRFRRLPLKMILTAIDTIYAAHLAIAEKGFIAVDFYDGCILYDFDSRQVHLCDLDEYRQGPFTLETDRLPGSRRFMAPEEWRRGACIDQATNVYTLGRTALELLGWSLEPESSWPGSSTTREVLVKATDPDQTRRYQTVADFVSAWREDEEKLGNEK
jgi:serine/threonine-protein kinase